jgi:hypothetical protein
MMGTFSIHRVMCTFGWEETAARVRFRHIRMDPVFFKKNNLLPAVNDRTRHSHDTLFVEKFIE